MAAILFIVFLLLELFLGKNRISGGSEKIFTKKRETSEKLEVIHAVRGSIIDRNGEVLAVSTPGYSISINPSQTHFSGRRVKDHFQSFEARYRSFRRFGHSI